MFEISSYAKLNLGLKITGKREDSYHNIESIFHTVSIKDTLYFKIFQEEDFINLKSKSNNIPLNSSNLVSKTIRLFRGISGEKFGVEVRFDKKIPVGSGLGGGSSNAGMTLLFLNRYFGYPLGRKALMDAALKIGSDVPFFLEGGTALVRGRGEILEPVEDFPELHFIVVIPPFSISTEWAYNEYDEESNQTLTNKDFRIILNSVKRGNCKSLKGLFNSFQRIIIRRYPVIRDIMDVLDRLQPTVTLLSGSGSAVYAVFLSEPDRTRIVEMLGGDYSTMHCRSVPRVEYFNSINAKED